MPDIEQSARRPQSTRSQPYHTALKSSAASLLPSPRPQPLAILILTPLFPLFPSTQPSVTPSLPSPSNPPPAPSSSQLHTPHRPSSKPSKPRFPSSSPSPSTSPSTTCFAYKPLYVPSPPLVSWVPTALELSRLRPSAGSESCRICSICRVVWV